MRRLLRYAGIVLVFWVSLQADDKKKVPQLYSKPGQTVDLDAPQLVTAKQSCENWAIAAGLESLLKQQNVPLDQNFWVMRISGGEICVPDLPSADALADLVNKEFVLESGRHVALEMHYVPGAPDNPDSLIAGLKQQRLSLLLVRGHVYYLTGVTYDEHVRRDGGRMFIITELRLANTFPREPGITFVKGRDNMDEIGGMINLTATQVPLRW